MKKEKNKSRYIFLAFTVLTAILIFFMSAQNGTKSADTSGLLIERLFGGLFRKLGINLSDIKIFAAVDHIVRKLAHFGEYALLGFNLSGFLSTFDKPKYFTPAAAAASGFLYACSDEFHQYFVPARSARFTDVLIDFSGVLTGTVFFIVLFAVIKAVKNKRTSGKDQV